MKNWKTTFPASLAILSMLMFSACKKDTYFNLTPNTFTDKYLNIDLENLPNYANPDFPLYYRPDLNLNDNTPANNAVTDEAATLGRVLFYDKNLSLNNTISCASCHQQANGFTDEAVLSAGFTGGQTGAHSMRLGNARFYAAENMFWNRRAATLEEQTIMPIQDHIEMGFDSLAGGMDSLINKLHRLIYYPVLFQNAFGTSAITEQRIQQALAQFVRSLISVNSKFDEGYAQVFNPTNPPASLNAAFPNFTTQENMGKSLFLLPPNQGGAGCAGCHLPGAFSLVPNSLSNGLDRGETTIFKSPSLKNVAMGGPYMHDGRFATLEEVVEHYNSGIQPGPALDNRLRGPNGQAIRLNLSQGQKEALVAFLRTLDDETLVMDPKFSNPFR